MTGSASQFVGDIPGNYDLHLGPNIFEDYAADIARRATALKPLRVLELAAGTGIVSRKLRDALPAGARLVVTDLNAPMLEIARRKFREGEAVEFAAADAMKLGYPHGTFDAVVCQFGVMFFPDKVASFREALRVLRPGGTFLFNTWGTQADNPFAGIAQEISAKFFPQDPPGFYRVPFSCAHPAPLVAGLKEAGFEGVTHEVVSLRKTVTDLSGFARGLVFGNPLVDEINKRGGVSPETVVETVERELRAAFGLGAVMPLKANLFSARRPG